MPGQFGHRLDAADVFARDQDIDAQAFGSGPFHGGRRRPGPEAGHREEFQQRGLHRLQEWHRRGQLQSPSAGQVDVLRPGCSGNRPQVVQQGGVGHGAHEDQATGKEPPVVEFHEQPRGVLVSHLHPERAQLPDL